MVLDLQKFQMDYCHLGLPVVLVESEPQPQNPKTPQCEPIDFFIYGPHNNDHFVGSSIGILLAHL